MFYGDEVIQYLGDLLDRNLTLAEKNLAVVYVLLDESGEVLVSAEDSLDTVRDAIVDVIFTLTDTRPLIDETSQVITQDVPDALEGVQASMPSLIETAAAVDETLTFLSAFQFTIPNFLGDDWQIGLGIDYDPEVPLNQALGDLSSNLENIPEDLRGMENDLNTASMNLLTLRDDLSVLADDLYLVSQQVEDLNPQIEQLAENLLDMQTSLDNMQEKFSEMLPTIRLIYMAFLSLILLGQVPSAYVGVMLMRGGGKLEKTKVDEED